MYPVQTPPDPCNPTPCGPYTTCQVVAERAVCFCLPGYFGNPDVGCETECTVSSDCPPSKACVNFECIDPCVGTCGSRAICSVVSHNPLCSCEVGFTGDPLVACYPKPGELAYVTSYSIILCSWYFYFVFVPYAPSLWNLSGKVTDCKPKHSILF